MPTYLVEHTSFKFVYFSLFRIEHPPPKPNKRFNNDNYTLLVRKKIKHFTSLCIFPTKGYWRKPRMFFKEFGEMRSLRKA